MNIFIKRDNLHNKEKQEFTLKEFKEFKTVLESLTEIKEEQDNSLAFRSGCKSGICGSCTVRVNGVEVLACKTNIKENDYIEATKNNKVIKDLIVDLDNQKELLARSNSFISSYNDSIVNKEDEEKIYTQSNCILCNSCYSSCPIYEVNQDFIGPYALTRNYRYFEDIKENDKISKLNSVQIDGIWDCTLCGNCTLVCPQGIDPKNDILNLRMKSVQNGFEDKSMINSNFNTGFNPNFF